MSPLYTYGYIFLKNLFDRFSTGIKIDLSIEEKACMMCSIFNGLITRSQNLVDLFIEHRYKKWHPNVLNMVYSLIHIFFKNRYNDIYIIIYLLLWDKIKRQDIDTKYGFIYCSKHIAEKTLYLKLKDLLLSHYVEYKSSHIDHEIECEGSA